MRNKLTSTFIDRVLKTENNKLNHIDVYGPEKFNVKLVLPYVGARSTNFESSIKKMIEKFTMQPKIELFSLLAQFLVLGEEI